MNYLIVKNGVIDNIIACEDDATAAQFGAVACYDGAEIGDLYSPPPAPVEYTETQQLAQALTDLELGQIEMGQQMTELELLVLSLTAEKT